MSIPVRLVTFDFWRTLLADTPESVAAAHALRLAGVGDALRRAGRPYDASAVAVGDARALAILQPIWRGERDVTLPDQVRIFLEALDPALPTALSVADREAVEAAYATPALTHGPAIAPGAVEAVTRIAAEGGTPTPPGAGPRPKRPTGSSATWPSCPRSSLAWAE